MRLTRWAMLLALAACSSPDPAYFALQPVPGAVHEGPAQVIEVRRPGVPAMLDRQEIVLDGTQYRLRLESGARWAEPFGDMVARVLVRDLAQRLPAARVFGEGGALSADPALRVELDVQTLAADAAGVVHLSGAYALTAPGGHAARGSGRIDLTAPTSGGPAGLAAAMSGLLGAVADRIAVDMGR